MKGRIRALLSDLAGVAAIATIFLTLYALA